MRMRITARDLRDEVREEIASSIEMHRASRSSSDPAYEPPSGPPTEDEIDDFVTTNQLFDDDTVEFLTAPALIGFEARTDSVRAEWLEEFRQQVADWANTNTWLGADLIPTAVLAMPAPAQSTLWTPGSGVSPPDWLTPAAILLASDLLRSGRLLSELHWRDFERLIAELLERSGWYVELMAGTKDGGVDVVATLDDPVAGAVKAIWQAKKYGPSNKVGLSQVRELSAIRDDVKATKGLIVTTSHLTRGAIDWIRRDEYRMGYKDREAMERWVRDLA